MKQILAINLIAFLLQSCETKVTADEYKFTFFREKLEYAGCYVGDIYVVNDCMALMLGVDREQDDSGKWLDLGTILFRTEDGGRTFEKQYFKDSELYGFGQSVDNKSLYAKKRGIDKEQPYSILKSQDLGMTWKEIYQSDDNPIYDVNFYNDTIGFAYFNVTDSMGNGSILHHTIDGGVSWHPIDTGFEIYDNMTLTQDGRLIGKGWGGGDNSLSLYQMDVFTLEISALRLNVPSKLGISGSIKKNTLTGKNYVVLRGDKADNYLCCIETSDYQKLPDKIYGLDMEVYGGYVEISGASHENTERSYSKTYYSHDMGKQWLIADWESYSIFSYLFPMKINQ